MDAMYSVLNKGMELYFPTKLLKIHQTDKPWITPRIKKDIAKRQAAFEAHETSKWRQLRNEVKREIEKAKVNYNANRVRKLQKTEPRKWYQQIKCMLNSSNSDLDMHIPGVDRANHKAMANAINSKFVSVSSHVNPLDHSELPTFLPAVKPAPVLYPWDVYSELKRVKTSKSSGPDGIPPKIIKEFAYELSGPLTDVLNCSFEEGIVPHQWKSAIVVPIPKQHPPSIDKMRPISLTDIFAKVAEGFVAKWIVYDIEPYIDINQFGNVSGISTSHYLINLVHTLFQGSDKRNNAVINDAAEGCSSHYWKYVDDLTFVENRACSEKGNLQSDLDDFLDWSVSNHLKLNPDKCQAIQICFMRNPPSHPILKIGHSLLSFVSSAKVLGIFIQQDLKWDAQVDHMCKCANKRLFMLRSLKRFGFNV
ncbi:uncharacterized protein [Amphiura filiformis]|uniref:uncharacterized protein n=1 Tax=Amphiura filiformis TaxID=82378 RepID=UPI003B22717A